MARRLDRRVQRTRKLLREALMALILEEGFDAISIQDITNKANLGRATFYLHFKDKDELLQDVMEQFVADFLEQVPQFLQNQWRMEDTKAAAKLFDFATENYDLYRILSISSAGITAARQLHHTITQHIRTCIQQEVDESHTIPILPIDFIAQHWTGSLLSTIYWWLDNDLPYTSDEMAAMFQQIRKQDHDSVMGFSTDQEPQMDIPKSKRKKRSKHESKIGKQAPNIESEDEPEFSPDEPEAQE